VVRALERVRGGGRGAELVLALLVGAYVLVFGTLTWRQQSAYGTFGFDMGLHDQGIWLTSRFTTPFVTVRGMNYFGHHVNLVSLLYVPFYWLGAGPHFLYLTETLALAFGAVPVFLLARRRLAGPVDGAGWLALVPAAAWLLHPSLEWINWWHWHPEAMAITPLLFAWWFAVERRWQAFAGCVFVALLCKEDVALAVLMLGVVLVLVAGRRWGSASASALEPGSGEQGADVAGTRRAGVATAAAGLAWFLACTRVVIPAILGAAPFYERELFPAFGTSFGSVLWGIVSSPGKVASMVFEAGRLAYYFKLVGPFGVLAPVAGLPLLLIGGPQAGINVLSSLPGTYDIRFQYSAVVLVAVALASVEGLGWLWRSPRRALRAVGVAALVSMGVGAVAGNVAWSPSPVGHAFDTGIWARRVPRHDVFDRAVAMVPASASVSASYYLIPHLTHRRAAYEWPNPWILVNWGLSGEKAPDPASVDYLVLDRALHQEPGLVASLTAAGGAYEVLLDDDDVLVARRRSSPASPSTVTSSRPRPSR
jgi:uncharacterized membrane protein